MLPPLKLSAIDREHLQELYDASGVARDDLPYTDAFEELWQGFDDRTFKNAEREQVYQALLKHVRSSKNAPVAPPEEKLDDGQIDQLRIMITRQTGGSKILPYSDEFESVYNEFAKQSGLELTKQEFWHAVLKAQGAKRRTAAKSKAAKTATEPTSSDA